jgi:hypothetical protein
MVEERDDLEIYMLNLVDLKLADRQGVTFFKFWTVDITKRGSPGKHGDDRSKKRRLHMELDQRLTS